MIYPHKWSPIGYRSSTGQRKHTGQRPMDRRNCVLDGSPAVLRDIAMATNCGFVGYNFGSMIASDTLFDSMGGFLGSSYRIKT